jgi:hypothetical protein
MKKRHKRHRRSKANQEKSAQPDLQKTQNPFYPLVRSNIISDIMTRKRLDQIKQQIAAARRRSNSFSDLAAIAQALGRKRAKGAQARGKEPAFISTLLNVPPITIPYHGRDIKPGTAKNILNQLEEDVLRFDRLLEEEERRSGNGYDNGEDRD